MGALRDVEFFLADHDSCGGLEVRTCPPTSAVGYYLALTCCCGGFRVKWAMSEHAMFNLIWPIQPYTSKLTVRASSRKDIMEWAVAHHGSTEGAKRVPEMNQLRATRVQPTEQSLWGQAARGGHTMRRLGGLLALAGILTLGLSAPAFAGSSTDAALGLGAFAVFNQILSGTGVFGAGRPVYREVVVAPAAVVVQQPPAVIYSPPPAVIYGPPPVVYAPAPPPPVYYVPAPAPVYAYPYAAYPHYGAYRIRHRHHDDD